MPQSLLNNLRRKREHSRSSSNVLRQETYPQTRLLTSTAH
jgi:hypothetical protein